MNENEELIKALKCEIASNTGDCPMMHEDIECGATCPNYSEETYTIETLLKKSLSALEAADKELAELREATTDAWLQLRTASFSTNKGAADLAKFILTFLPEPPQKENK